jgi:hypothetical protein
MWRDADEVEVDVRAFFRVGANASTPEQTNVMRKERLNRLVLKLLMSIFMTGDFMWNLLYVMTRLHSHES